MTISASLRAVLFAALAPACLAAQNFEGVITMQGKGAPSKIWIKDTRMRVEWQERPGAAIRDAQGRLLTLMEARHAYIVLPATSATLRPLSYTPAGRSETVAGYPCDVYSYRDPYGGKNKEACITSSLGYVGFGPGGPMNPDALRALRAQFPKGFMVLKTADADGGGTQVVKVERAAVSDAMFAPPAGYSEIRMGPPPPTSPR